MNSFQGVNSAILRALKLSENAFRKLGYEIVPVSFDEELWTENREIYMGLTRNGAAKRTMQEAVDSGERIVPSLNNNLLIFNASYMLRKLIDCALSSCLGKSRLVTMLNGLRWKSDLDIERLVKQKYQLNRKIAKIWQDYDIDALLSPLYPVVAPKIATITEVNTMVEYSIMWNNTGYPCGTLPVTEVKEDEQSFSDDYNDAWTRAIKQHSEGSKGLPVSVQLTGYI